MMRYYLFLLLLTTCMCYASQMFKKSGYQITNVDTLIKHRHDIVYTKIHDEFFVYPKKHPFLDDEICPGNGPICIPETFVLSVPYGSVYSSSGLILVDDMYVKDFFWHGMKKGRMNLCVDVSLLDKPKKIHGKVAVLAQFGSKCYYHWMLEVLPRLALLQKSGVSYDYLYISSQLRYMQETLELLGVDVSKIIGPSDDTHYIQADELIIPSEPSACRYSSDFVIHFLRDNFIPLAEKFVDYNKLSKKVFIRRDENSIRRIANEDEVFELLQPYGFVGYTLEELSVLEQVALFHHADIIVAEHGAGLTNIVFAQPGTKVIEIFQASKRLTYWYISQQLGLDHVCLQTIPFSEKNIRHSCPSIPLEPIKKIINQLFEKIIT